MERGPEGLRRELLEAERRELRELDEDDLLKLFAYEHLPAHLQTVSAPIGELARAMQATLPSSAQRLKGLEFLVLAKDAFVRAALDAPKEEPKPEPDVLVVQHHDGSAVVHHATDDSDNALAAWVTQHVAAGYRRLLVVVAAPRAGRQFVASRLSGIEGMRPRIDGIELRNPAADTSLRLFCKDDDSGSIKGSVFDAAWIAPGVGAELRAFVETRVRAPGQAGMKVVHTMSFKGSVLTPPPAPTPPAPYVRHDPKPEGA
jgi:hypothetical protein